ncbi:MAG: hypothetical protein ACXAC5_01790 [Promethearchaeota archaeon]|jgi:hypothetical protein
MSDKKLGPAASLIGAGAILLVAFTISGISTIPGCLEREKARNLCQSWCKRVLVEAKSSNPEIGIYEAFLPAADPWNNPLQSTLRAGELENVVTVVSIGKDEISGTTDDIVTSDVDVHIRKTISKGIQSGAHSFGKGLAGGVVEGLGEVKEASLSKAKIGFTKAKDSLMSRFKKREPQKQEEMDQEETEK